MALYISSVEISNVRCFEKLKIEFNNAFEDPPWTMFVGDNATGKTTLLRCIAMGLCDASSAAGLLRESDEGIIRRSRKNAVITINLTDPESPKKKFQIRTQIDEIKMGESSFEHVSQRVIPGTETFPWHKIFVCAYGAGRGTSGTGDIAGYSSINSTYNLFNYTEGLQNPELTLRRILDRNIKSESIELLKSVLGPSVTKVSLREKGIAVSGSWGEDMPLRDLADGFKSSFLWVTDFLGWALERNPDIKNLSDITGIILVDEIEQHLHPKWRLVIVETLKSTFPKIQFFTTTHSELVARSVGGLQQYSNDILYRLELNSETNSVTGESIDTIEALGPTEALMSPAFDTPAADAKRVSDWLRELTDLAQKTKRTPSQDAKLRVLNKYFGKIDFEPGSNELERRVEREIEEELLKKLRRKQKAPQKK